MPKVLKPIRPVLVCYVCDTCGGEMRVKRGGRVFYTDPPQIEHECWQTMFSEPDKKCATIMLNREYPHIDYVSVEIGQVLD